MSFSEKGQFPDKTETGLAFSEIPSLCDPGRHSEATDLFLCLSRANWEAYSLGAGLQASLQPGSFCT